MTGVIQTTLFERFASVLFLTGKGVGLDDAFQVTNYSRICPQGKTASFFRFKSQNWQFNTWHCGVQQKLNLYQISFCLHIFISADSFPDRRPLKISQRSNQRPLSSAQTPQTISSSEFGNNVSQTEFIHGTIARSVDGRAFVSSYLFFVWLKKIEKKEHANTTATFFCEAPTHLMLSVANSWLVH